MYLCIFSLLFIKVILHKVDCTIFYITLNITDEIQDSTRSNTRPWFYVECATAVTQKLSAYQAWADVVWRKTRYNNTPARSCKKTVQKARFDHINCIGARLASSWNKVFWSFVKSVETNFCRSSLPPLIRFDRALDTLHRWRKSKFFLVKAFVLLHCIHHRLQLYPVVTLKGRRSFYVEKNYCKRYAN